MFQTRFKVADRVNIDQEASSLCTVITRGNTCDCKHTVMVPSFWTYRPGQTVQTQVRLLPEEQSDQGLHCLLFHLHLFDEIP